MAGKSKNVYEKRSYTVTSVAQAKSLSEKFLLDQNQEFEKIKFGLPEVEDRYHVWRIPILDDNKERLGELVIEAKTGEIDPTKSSDINVMLKKILTQGIITMDKKSKKTDRSVVARSELRSTIIQGDAEVTLAELPSESTLSRIKAEVISDESISQIPIRLISFISVCLVEFLYGRDLIT